MKAWLFALLLSYASAQDIIGKITNGEKRCAAERTDHSPNCVTSVSKEVQELLVVCEIGLALTHNDVFFFQKVQTTCVLENGEGCIGMKQPPLKGRYFIKTASNLCQTYRATIAWK